MKQVRVKKDDLLAILKKNKAEHGDIFKKAQDKFREVAMKEMDRQLKAARDGEPFVLERVARLIQPKNYTGEYDRAIKMLEMSVDDTIEITSQEFQNFVQDIWNWSRDWALSNSGYVKSGKFAGLLDE